jgi:hypothetical protein
MPAAAKEAMATGGVIDCGGCHERNACQRDRCEVDQPTAHVSALLFRQAKLFMAGIMSSRDGDDSVRKVSKPQLQPIRYRTGCRASAVRW